MAFITGGAGFIGSHFARLWRHRGGEVVNLDRLTYAGDVRRLGPLMKDPRHHFLQVDVTDPSEVRDAIRRFRPELVVHFAAETHVTRSESNPQAFWRTNVQGTKVMLEEAAAGRVRRFLHISTDEVYGARLHGAFREEEKEPGEAQATSAYAKSKSCADDLARRFTGRLEVVVARPTNCFGPWQSPEKAVPRWIIRAVTGGSVPVWGDGEYVRQWLFAEDLVRAIALLADQPSPEPVYNIGPRHDPDITNADLVRWLLDRLGLPHDRLVLTAYDRPNHDRRYAVDPTRIERLGWRAGDIWNQLAETLHWYRDADWWWRSVLAGAESIYRDDMRRVP